MLKNLLHLKNYDLNVENIKSFLSIHSIALQQICCYDFITPTLWPLQLLQQKGYTLIMLLFLYRYIKSSRPTSYK